MTSDTDQLIRRYRELLLQRKAAFDTPSTANKLFEHNHALYKQLRETEEGRQAITALLDDEEVEVRLTAAVDSLEWATDRATAVLEEIENGPGLESVTAKFSLIAHRNGTLNLDW